MTNNQRKYYLYRYILRDIYIDSSYRFQNFLANFLSDSSIVISDAQLSQIITKLNELRALVPTPSAPKIGRASLNIDELLFPDTYVDFQNKFSEIMQILGVTYTKNGTGTDITNTITFTLPNNTTKTLSASPIYNTYIILQPRQEYSYAKKTNPYYSLSNLELLDITNIPYNVGLNTYWRYESSNNTVVIYGTGRAGDAGLLNPTFTPYEITSPSNTLVIERTINHVNYLVTTTPGTVNPPTAKYSTVVFKHLTTDNLTIQSGAFLAPKNASNPKFKYIIYADHPAVRNYSFSANVDVEWHNVSEWSD